MGELLRVLILIVLLLPSIGLASLGSCFAKLGLYNPVVESRGLGSGNNAYVTLEQRADGSFRKLKRYKYDQESFLASDVRDANFAADVLRDTQWVGAARYKRTMATSLSFKDEVEIEYFEGDTVQKKLESLDKNAAAQLREQYSGAVRKMLHSFLIHKNVRRIVLEPDGTRREPLELKSAADLMNLPEACVELIDKGILSFDVYEKAMMPNSEKEVHSYYAKPDNFIHTPEGDFVMIDPF